ncbi:prephenate dehydratase [Candidatus Auribacterota bacterium]
MADIKSLREKIDQADMKILKLVNERAKLAQKIGKVKKDTKTEIFSPAREEEVYERIVKENKGPLEPTALKAIYKEIMSGAKSLEKELTISYLGPEASFTHQAAMSKFGASVIYKPEDTIKDVFFNIEKGKSDYGVVPVENSTEGMVTYTLDMFIESNLKVCSEVMLHISHNLMVTPTAQLKNIQKIYSKAQVFGQCKAWLRNFFPKAELLEVSSTTKAAQIVLKEKNAAAIASTLAAEMYKLNILNQAIEDNSYNVTRFLVIGKNYSKKTKKDKTSIVFLIKDKVGALYDSLKSFKKYKINLTKIESRPSKRKAWEYYFYVDFLGHCEEKKIKEALKELEKQCVFVRILGSYPTGSLSGSL